MSKVLSLIWLNFFSDVSVTAAPTTTIANKLTTEKAKGTLFFCLIYLLIYLLERERSERSEREKYIHTILGNHYAKNPFLLIYL